MRFLGFSSKRSIPLLYKTTLAAWDKKRDIKGGFKRHVYFFNDEFTNYNDTHIGIKAIMLLNRLGYGVSIPTHTISGRTYLSKGFLKKAKKIANDNVRMLKDIISAETPLVGTEPSAILSFRDEYPEIVDQYLRDDATKLASNALMLDEFLANEIDKGNITKEQFTTEKRHIKLHGQCLLKSLASTEPLKKVLSLPENYTVEEIPSGCCGMAGAFGYEAEHYDLSMKIGELVLFPAVRDSDPSDIICAPGTSCRKQIKDGTGRTALHPVEVLWDSLV
jgi:Fe-S oxidoreductase